MSNSRSTSLAVKVAVGSSRMSSLLSKTRVLAISISCICATPRRATGVVGANVEADLLEEFGGATVHLAIIDDAAPLGETLEHQVLGDRHLRQHRQFLMHDADAGAERVGRGERAIGLAVEGDFAVVGAIDAGEQVDQRRLARAVLAEQHMALAARHLQRDPAQRDHAGEALAHAGQGQDREVVHPRFRGYARSGAGGRPRLSPGPHPCPLPACQSRDGVFRRPIREGDCAVDPAHCNRV